MGLPEASASGRDQLIAKQRYMGSLMLNVAPLPGAESTFISPPWSSTIIK